MPPDSPALLSPGSCVVRALYPFQSAESSSLDFRPGDIINVLSKMDSGWWLGSVVANGDSSNNNKPKWFPKDYVEVITPDDLFSQMKNSNVALASSVKPDRDDEMVLRAFPSPTTVEKQYHFNPDTGEMSLSISNALILDEEDPFPTHGDARPWLQDEVDGHAHDGDDYEENTFSAEKLPLPWAKYIVPRDYMDVFPEALEADRMDTRNATLTWEALSSCIAITIHNLNSAIRYNKSHLYHPYTLATVNVVRFMLIMSGSTNKNHFHKSLQAPHRSLIAILARLTLSTLFLEKVQSSDLMKDWADVVDKQGLATNARELLVALRTFVTACQAIPIKLMRPEPDLNPESLVITPTATTTNNISTTITTILEEDSQNANHGFAHINRRMPGRSSSSTSPPPSTTTSFPRVLRTASTSTYRTSSTTRSNSTTGTSVMSDTGTESTGGDEVDLDVIRTYGESLQRSVDSMLAILDNYGLQQQTALTGLLFTRLDHLSSCTTQLVLAIEPVWFEEEEEVLISVSKQALLNGFGRIFCNLQLATGEHAQLDTLMGELRDSIEAIKEPIATLMRCIESASLGADDDGEYVPVPSLPAVTTTGTGDNVDSEMPNSPLLSPEELSRLTLKPPEEKWYMGHDYTEETLNMSTDGNVKSGTLAALVERLTPHDQLDMNFIRTFLLTYRSFCTAGQLFKLLKARFNQGAPDGLTAAELEDWKERKQKVIRLRIFNVMKMWVEYYFNIEEDLLVLDDMLDFIDSTPDFSAKKQLERVIQQLQSDSDDPLRKMISTPRDAPEPMLPRNTTKFKLLDIPPLELARQMTIMDFNLYRSIKPSECLNKGWSSPDEIRSPNIRSSIEYNNQVTMWVCSTILGMQDVKKRGDVVKYWIQVSDKCRELNNFNTCMAILSAFDSSSIGRLRRTWDMVGARHLASLTSLRSLFSPTRNFNEYRSQIHSANPPCIPFLGIYLQDLTFIEDGNPNVVKNENREDHINFSKLDKTGQVIWELQQFQDVAYPLQSVGFLQYFITSNLKSYRDEEKIYLKSLAVEPREREDEKVARLLEESGML